MDTNQRRIVWIDWLRIIAMMAVVCNHSWGYFSVDHFNDYVGDGIYYVDMALNTFTRFNVPIFLMISGYLMLSNIKNDSIRRCLRKSGGTEDYSYLGARLYGEPCCAC